MYVYFIQAGRKGAIKIGVARNIDRRIDCMQTGNPFKLRLLAAIPCQSRTQALDLERKIHERFARQRVRGEWFQNNIRMTRVESLLSYAQQQEVELVANAKMIIG